MKFYEATNGYMGFSYVKCYVWAENEEQAMKLATESYKKHAEKYGRGEIYYKNIELQLLVDTEKDFDPFYTDPED